MNLYNSLVMTIGGGTGVQMKLVGLRLNWALYSNSYSSVGTTFTVKDVGCPSAVVSPKVGANSWPLNRYPFFRVEARMVYCASTPPAVRTSRK